MKCHRGVILCAAMVATLLLAAVYIHNTNNHSGTLCSTCSGSITPAKPSTYAQLPSPHPSFLENRFKSEPSYESVRVSNISNDLMLSAPLPLEVRGVIRAPDHCEQMNCREHLSSHEKNVMKACENRVRRVEHIMGLIKNSDCSFLPEAGRAPVALASGEGSGNTWTRGLLEKATGICTGFINCDAVMRSRGYVGESLKSGKVLVVKTHSLMPKWKGANNTKSLAADSSYGSAVFILRNPFNAAIAEWNRRTAQEVLGKSNSSITLARHTYVVPQELFKGEQWETFVKTFLMKNWKLRIHQWVIEQNKYPVHILRYEDLQKNTLEEILRVLDFLNVSYDYDTVAERLREDYSEFHRPHNTVESEHYSDEQKQQLRSWFMDIIIAAENAGKSHLLRLDEYLSTL